jgi:hypothetical protein
MNYRDELLKNHCEKRTNHEEKTDTLINHWITTYFPDKDISVTRTQNEFDTTDYIINGNKFEVKTRTCSLEDINKYKQSGFVLSKDKLENNDYILYYLTPTHELYYISKQKIEYLYNQGIIQSKQIYTNTYYFEPRLGKTLRDCYLIPEYCFSKKFIVE